jgi:hypothetical protein
MPKVAMNRKLIRTLHIDLKVMDTRKAAEEVEGLVTATGGYVASSNVQRRGEFYYFEMILRIPTNHFGNTVKALKSMAEKIDRESLGTQDVTEQYVDHEARLRTLKATELELSKLLADSRKQNRKVEDILRIYSELTTIRSRIEQIEGRLKSLARLVEFSTVHLSLHPDESAIPVVEEGWQPLETLRSSGRALLCVLKFLADVLIYVVIVIVPIFLIIAAPVYISIRLGRKRRPAPPVPSDSPVNPPPLPRGSNSAHTSGGPQGD